MSHRLPSPHGFALAVLLTSCAGENTPPTTAPAAADPSIGGEAAHDRYPEHDEHRDDQYDPATETDAYMHRESNDDEMLEHQCMEEGCPEQP